MYDPFQGRFLSPDPYVQDPLNPLNHNRYAYCLNNPTKYTDPSGEFWHLVIGAAIGGTINVLMNLNNIDNFGQGLAYFGIGAAAGALGAGVGAGVSSAMAGGSFGAGFVGSSAAMTATTSFGTGAAIGGAAGFSGGFVSGTGNGLMQGQDIGQALWFGTKTGIIGGATGALLGGLAGGIDAHADGRNFWNGAPQGRPMYITSKGNIPVDYYEDLTRRVNEQRANGITDSWEQRLHKKITTRINNNIGLDASGKVPQSRDFYINDKYFKGDINYRSRGYIPRGESVTLSVNGRQSLVLNQSNYRWTQGVASNVNRMGISMSGTPVMPSGEIIVTPTFDFRLIGLWVH